MAGYIGTKAALLSTTTASVGGDSTVGGDLTVDTDTLYVDSTNNRVGVGTSSPAVALQLNDAATNSVGTTAGDFVEQFRFYGNNGNSTHISQYTVREANGSDWTTSGNRLQTKVDATYMGWMQFNQNGGGQGISFGTGTDGSSPLNVPERMRIDASGRVTMPYQPSFRVGKTTSTSGNQVVVFDHEFHDIGNNYNTSTGRFTCPVDGIYYFGWQGISNFSTTSNEQNVSLMVNGNGVNDTRFRGYTEQSGHLKSIQNLSAGDYVEVTTANSNTQLFGSTLHNQFMGYLLG